MQANNRLRDALERIASIPMPPPIELAQQTAVEMRDVAIAALAAPPHTGKWKNGNKQDICNMAAMRKTLEEMAAELEDLANREGIRAPAYSSVFSIYAEKCRKALAAKPRVCDVYPAEGLKTIIITEMAKRCAAGLYPLDDLEMVKAVSDSVIDGLYSEMKEA